MLTLQDGTLTIQMGRLTVDTLILESNATLRNESEVYTHTTLSEGTIEGGGTLWAHVSSKLIGGVIDAMQIIIYWPKELLFGLVLPMCFGNLFSIPKQTGTGELT